MTRWLAHALVPVVGAALWAVACRGDGCRGRADPGPPRRAPSGTATTSSREPAVSGVTSSLGRRDLGAPRGAAVRVSGVPATVTALASDGQRLVWADEQGLGELTPAGSVRRLDGAAVPIRDVGVLGSAVAWLQGGDGKSGIELWSRQQAASERLLAGSGWGGGVRLRMTPWGWFVGGISCPGWQRLEPDSHRVTRLESDCNEEDVGFLDASSSVVAAVGGGGLCVGSPASPSLRRVPSREPVSALTVDEDEVFFAAGSLGSDTNTESSVYQLRAGGGAGVELVSGETFVVSLVRHSGRLYWLDERGALRGFGPHGEAMTLAAGPRGPRGSPGWRLAAAGRYVYWIVPSLGLYRAVVDETE